MHILLDFLDCKVPQSKTELESVLRHCATLIGATVVQCVLHEFSPWGLSGVLVIAESHIAVHTYPEYKTIHVDLFTCGDMDCEEGVRFLQSVFGGDMIRYDVDRKLFGV